MTPAPGVRLDYFGLVPTPCFPSAPAGDRSSMYDEIAALVARLRTALAAQGELAENESLALRARITPLDAQGRPRESRDVRLRLLDQRGLAFEHPAPLADRRAWVSVESPKFGGIAAEIELSWCRYIEGGRYASGGRFVQFGTPPEALDD